MSDYKETPLWNNHLSVEQRLDYLIQEMTLEEKLAKLDAMTEQLRKEDITLEESFSLYKDGMELIKQCNADIDRVEKQVQILNADGQVTDWDEE